MKTMIFKVSFLTLVIFGLIAGNDFLSKGKCPEGYGPLSFAGTRYSTNAGNVGFGCKQSQDVCYACTCCKQLARPSIPVSYGLVGVDGENHFAIVCIPIRERTNPPVETIITIAEYQE